MARLDLYLLDVVGFDLGRLGSTLKMTGLMDEGVSLISKLLNPLLLIYMVLEMTYIILFIIKVYNYNSHAGHPQKIENH